MTGEPQIKVKLIREGARLPFRATPGSTGLDLYACLEPPGYVDLGPDLTLVPTGLIIEAPSGFDLEVRPRSGLARQGVNVVIGTLDADYRGELFVGMHTFGTRATYRVQTGDRIAQLIVSRFEALPVVQVDALSDSERGSGGYGSTGR